MSAVAVILFGRVLSCGSLVSLSDTKVTTFPHRNKMLFRKRKRVLFCSLAGTSPFSTLVFFSVLNVPRLKYWSD